MKDILLRVVLVDDEPDSIKVSEHLLQKYHPEVQVLASFTNPEEALNYLKSNVHIDALLLDVEMPKLNGFDLIEQLGKVKYKIIFVTAYDKYMLKAIKSSVFDYLIKPIDRFELAKAIQRITENSDEVEQPIILQHNERSKIILPTGKEYEFVSTNEIVRCESNSNYSIIYFENTTKITISKTLKYLEEVLPANIFIRVHSKHLINIHHIKKFVKAEGGYIVLDTDETIPISRERKDSILSTLGIR
jgi:two-component system, LytTR family, response regulator